MLGSAEATRHDRTHVVRFYSDEHALTTAVADYVARGLSEARPAIVIASPVHVQAFRKRLEDMRVDLSPSAAAPCELLDAEETLHGFMVDGSPDPRAFDATVGALVRSLAAAGSAPVAYGEMVALLWAEGNATGAIELEALWNGLLERESFSLYCAYPISILEGGDADAIRTVCELHSEIFGHASIPVPDVHRDRRTFTRSVDGPREARRFVEQTLKRWDLAELVPDAILVVSEMATNAIVHARTDFNVIVAREGDTVRIDVIDAGRPIPDPSPAFPDPFAGSGRGIHIIRSLSEESGSDTMSSGKRVWARLSTG